MSYINITCVCFPRNFIKQRQGVIFAMSIMNIGLIVLVLSGLCSLALTRRDSSSWQIGVFGCIVGCSLCLLGGLWSHAGWSLTRGELQFRHDMLSLLFQLPILVLGLVGGIHSVGYFRDHCEGRQGVYWFFYNLMLACMIWVTLAVRPIEFLLSWELMGLLCAFLVMFNYREKGSGHLAWIYLLACHASGLVLQLMFVFGDTHNSEMLFLIVGLVGFGLKIGFPLLHVWLTEAQPAAPAPALAVMSGSMLNLGFYGLFRHVSMSGNEFFAGTTFTILGLVGMLFGVMFALGQGNLKRLLAYSSMGNMGIVGLGVGLGFLGSSSDNIMMAVFGMSGALLHMMNHSCLKGCLFMGSGSIWRAAGELRIDRLGGLLKKMPWTGRFFSCSSISLSGLPPFNGFTGVFLLYMSAFHGMLSGTGVVLLLSVASVLALALAGGLASAMHAKAIGGVFLGESRLPGIDQVRDTCKTMRYALGALSILSFALLLSSPWLVGCFGGVIEHVLCLGGYVEEGGLTVAEVLWQEVFPLLLGIVVFSFLTLVVVAVLMFVCRLLPGRKLIDRKGAWDCGFAKPTSRMQYTGTAFVQPLVDYFSAILRPIRQLVRVEGLFPTRGSCEIRMEDGGIRGFWGPLFRLVGWVSRKVHRLQCGYLHVYLLIMVVSLFCLLFWGFVLEGVL